MVINIWEVLIVFGIVWFLLSCFNLTLFTPSRFKIRVLYKSGNSHECWCRKFEIENGEWTWVSHYQFNRPILMGVDEIEAVHQTEIKLNLFGVLWGWFWQLVGLNSKAQT